MFKVNQLSVFISTVLLVNTTVRAQETVQDGVKSDLEVIEVTSRKRAESLNKIPVAVSAFTEEMIEQQGFQSLDDIARFSPGLSFSKAFGRSTERPVIRGMSNVLAGVQFGVESGAAYFVDGNYFAGDIQSIDMSNIQRVEIVKGPQSALYGRNSYSGAINFITKSPSDAFSARTKVLFAEDGEHTFSVNADIPINEWLHSSVSIRDYNYDGQWENEVTGKTVGDESTRSYSLVLDAQPSDSLHLRWRIQSQEDDDGTRPFFLQPATENNCFSGVRSLAYWPASGSDNNFQYYCGAIEARPIALNDGADADGVPNAVPGVPTSGFLPGGVTYFGNPYDLNDGTAFDGVENDLLFSTLAADYETQGGYVWDGNISYRNQDGRTGSDSDHSSVNFTFAPGQEGFFALSSRAKVIDKTAELKLRSPDADLSWMVGAFYYKQRKDTYDLTFDNAQVGLYENFSSVTNQAIFASVDYRVNPRFDITAEARWAKEKKVVTEYATTDGSLVFNEGGEWNNFTPRFTANYQLNEDTIIYGIAAKGVKPGGFNGSAGASVGQETYEQEETSSVEVGIKSRSFENMYATISAYYNDISKLQLTTAVPNPDGALNSIATNQGEGEVFGVELDLHVQFTDNLNGRFSYAYADSQFTSGCDDFQYALTSAGGLMNPDNIAESPDFNALLGLSGEGDCSIKGNQFPLSSKHQASAFAEYVQEISGGIEGFINADVSYESKKYVQVHNYAYLPEAVIAGLRTGVRADNWSASLFVRNLTDEDAPVMATRWLAIPYFTFSSLNTAPDGADTGSPRAFFGNARRGRQIGLEFSYYFQ